MEGLLNGYIALTDSSLNIAPGDSAIIYSAIFLGSSYENMLEIAQYIEDSLEVAVDDESPQSFESNLQLQNYPNPMRGSTTISFSIHSASWRTKNAEIKIYNLKGQLVRKIKMQPPIYSGVKGKNNIVWDGKDKSSKPVSSGIYFYRLETENYQSSVKKLLLLR